MVNKIEAIELRKQGKTYEEIAIKYNVSRQRIHQIITGYRSSKKAENNKKYLQKYRAIHRESYNTKLRIYLQGKGKQAHKELKYKENQQIKRLVLTHYGNGKLACVKCGFIDIRALSIDHINGGGGKHTRNLSTSLYRWLIKNGYPIGYQTLCMNCQWIKRVENNEIKRTDLKNST